MTCSTQRPGSRGRCTLATTRASFNTESAPAPQQSSKNTFTTHDNKIAIGGFLHCAAWATSRSGSKYRPQVTHNTGQHACITPQGMLWRAESATCTCKVNSYPSCAAHTNTPDSLPIFQRSCLHSRRRAQQSQPTNQMATTWQEPGNLKWFAATSALMWTLIMRGCARFAGMHMHA